MARIYGTKSASGPGAAVVAAPPAGKEIKINFRVLQSFSATPTTILLKGGSNTLEGIRCAADAGGIAGVLPGEASIRCGNGQALYVDNSAAVEIHWTIGYTIVDYDAGA